jgi:PAS domain S-box-containing protein
MSPNETPYPRAPRKPRILFVEDEATLRNHLAAELSDQYTVDTAENGLDALRAVMRRKPDLIVTDIVMPEMDGVELLKTLRSEPGTLGLPVLLISGRAEEAQRIEGFREGADGYLAKPYSVGELRAVVGAMLQAAEHRADTARREARQQALAERAALLESITDAFYALDHELRFTYVNQRALDYWNREREELMGRRISDVFPVLKGTLIEMHLQRALREQSSAAFEALSPVAGSWLELNVYPAGQGLAIYFRDISDRKRAEQELQRTQEILRESDRRKSEFLALLAHELRNPLAPIGNGLKILQLHTAAPDPVAGRTLEMMERQLKHLVRLVDDLLDVGRITSGKLQLRTQRVVMADVLATAVDTTRSLIEGRGHQLAVDIRARDLTVEADPDRLVQVVANLLGNSAKYTERGGLIRLILEQEGREAVVAVADNGIGIPSQSIDNVFQMFSQLGSHASRSEGGLGIGLALVYRLVQMHGGTVSAASEGLGRGSTFTVRLPLEPSLIAADGTPHLTLYPDVAPAESSSALAGLSS